MLSQEQMQVSENFLQRLFPKPGIKKVLLVNPPGADKSFFQYDTAKTKRYTNYPPYGLAVIARNLKDVGVEVRISNLNNETLKRCIESRSKEEFDFDLAWIDRLESDISLFKPDLIGVGCTFSMGYEAFRTVCNHVGSLGIPIAVGGVYVTNDMDRILKDIPQVKIFFFGEADLAIRIFVQVVNGKLPISELAQVILHIEKEYLRFAKVCRPNSEDISLVPAYDLLDITENSRYGAVGNFYYFKPEDERFASILSSRGCRGNCIFCSVRNFNGPGIRQRTIPSVIDELELLVNRYGITHVTWLDDDLLFNHKRVIELFNTIVKKGLKITWDATNGVIAASCTDEVIAAAAESGCIGLNIGMESGNPKILREIRKPSLLHNFLDAAELLQKYEQIYSCIFLMIGFKDESMSMIKDTMDVALQMNLDWYRIAILEPLPNTPLYDSLKSSESNLNCDNRETRFMLGPYGKQREIEQGLRPESKSDYKQALSSMQGLERPDNKQLIDIWFYMNYYLNFYRLINEERLPKIQQQVKHLRCISDQIAPNHGFALYFLAYLEYKFFKKIDPDIVKRLQRRISESFYWRNRFEALGFEVDRILSSDWIPAEDDLGNPVPLFK